MGTVLHLNIFFVCLQLNQYPVLGKSIYSQGCSQRMSQKKVIVFLFKKYISVHLMHFDSSVKSQKHLKSSLLQIKNNSS